MHSDFIICKKRLPECVEKKEEVGAYRRKVIANRAPDGRVYAKVSTSPCLIAAGMTRAVAGEDVSLLAVTRPS